MPTDVVLYAPTGSGLRVRILQSPSRHGKELVCAAVFEGGPKRAPEQMAARLGRFLSAPSMQLAGARVERCTIIAPWDQREALKAALVSLLAVPARDASESALRARIDRNSLAGLVSHGAGLHHHFIASQRKWRFSAFTLVETFSLFTMTWAAMGEHDLGSQCTDIDAPRVVIQGGLNTRQERACMAARLAQGTDLPAVDWSA